MPYKEGKRWRGTPRYKGRRLQTRLFDKKSEALEYETEQRKKAAKTLQNGLDLLSICSKYLIYAERFSGKTFKEKQALIKRILSYFGGDTPINIIDAGKIQDYLDSQARERSNNGANKDRKNLSAIWEYGRRFLNVEHNPVRQTDKRSHTKSMQAVYREEEIVKMLLAATREEKIILLSFLETAARRNEIFNLTLEDLNIERRCLQINTKKTKDGSTKSRWLPISENLANEYAWWMRERPLKESLFLFPNVKTGKPYIDPRKWLKRISDRAGVPWKGFHAFRRYVASILNDKYKVSMKAVQELLGHARESTTEIYVHSISSSLRDMVGMAIPQEKVTHLSAHKKEGVNDDNR